MTIKTRIPRDAHRVGLRQRLVRWCQACLVGLVFAHPAVAMQVQRVSESAWHVEGQSALGTAANQNLISNAAFVVTPAGVVVVDALAHRTKPSWQKNWPWPRAACTGVAISMEPVTSCCWTP